MTTVPDISVPQGAASTPVTVTSPAETVAVPARSITAPARTITLAAYSTTINGKKVTVPSRTYSVPPYALTVPASSVTAPAQVLSFNVLQAAPAPAPEPTPTPTPTPAPTPNGPAGPASGTVFTKAGALHLNNAHDLVFDGVDFEGAGYGSGDLGALVFIEGLSYNLTFRNCIIGTNTGSGNGVKVYDLGYGMHDITFDHCHFAYQPRMGFECNGRSNPSGGSWGAQGGPGYLRVNVTNCTFDAGAGEAISYDDNYSASGNRAGFCTVSGNVIDGAGVGSAYQYGKVFEINGTHNMTVTGNYFGAGRDGIVNLQGQDASAMGWVFSGNTYDGSHVPAGVSLKNQVFFCQNVKGGARFADQIICGDYGSQWGYLTGCTGLDFSATATDGVKQLDSGYVASCSGIVWPK